MILALYLMFSAINIPLVISAHQEHHFYMMMINMAGAAFPFGLAIDYLIKRWGK